jgi:hypothetical protein
MSILKAGASLVGVFAVAMRPTLGQFLSLQKKSAPGFRTAV